MEGSLLKWTNYWNGWQPRWFILKDGHLFYYNSQTEASSDSCKRSFKVSMFDIIVSKQDSTRMDLIIANNQYLYLKACDYRERQKWLICLASQKAKYPNSTNEQQFVYHSSNLLKSKQCELRLYCDLLVQQIHEVKSVVVEPVVANDTKKMDEITTNINVTCEVLTSIIKNIITLTENPNQLLNASTSFSSNSNNSSPSNTLSLEAITAPSTRPSSVIINDSDVEASNEVTIKSTINFDIVEENLEIMTTSECDLTSNLYASINKKYSILNIAKGDKIPTKEFLEWCKEIFSILDIFGSTTFMPVKIDVYGNINKITQKYSTNEHFYFHVQSIVQHEIDEQVTHVRNSATDALLWLKRALWFIREFYREFIVKPLVEVNICLTKSYELTLKQYHNWIVKGIFSLALRSVPSRDNFIRGLLLKDSLSGKRQEIDIKFQEKILKDMKDTLHVMDNILLTLNEFYETNNLDNLTKLGAI